MSILHFCDHKKHYSLLIFFFFSLIVEWTRWHTRAQINSITSCLKISWAPTETRSFGPKEFFPSKQLGSLLWTNLGNCSFPFTWEFSESMSLQSQENKRGGCTLFIRAFYEKNIYLALWISHKLYHLPPLYYRGQ